MSSNSFEYEKLSAALLDNLPKDRIIACFAKAGGDELSSGRLASPESSAALAANTFGFFLEQPTLLTLPRPPLAAGDANSVELECEMRFPWSGGTHAWLDVVIRSNDFLIGIESKRYEPFRDEKRAHLSPAYSRDVWGPYMGPFTRMRDELVANPMLFKQLDAAQLIKHAFGIRTQAAQGGKAPHLLYLYAEPHEYPNGRSIPRAQLAQHLAEIEKFASAIDGAEVRFSSLSYSELFSSWKSLGVDSLQAHAQVLQNTFNV